jgi:hypothetical protein
VQALVDERTIDQHQASVLRQQIDAGSVDLEGLVQTGVLTTAQMQVVETHLRGVKESLAAGPATQPPDSSPTSKATVPVPSSAK